MQKNRRKEVTAMRKTLCILLLLLALAAPALAQTQVDEVRTQIGENYVAYPQLTGMADEAVQKKINDDIVLSSGVANHLVTLATLGDSPWGLKVDYQVKLLGENVFSAVINAEGKMPDGHEGQAYSALTYDLATGERLTLDALFEDVDAAVAWMEAAAEESLGQELSGYMEYSDITPLPREAFTLDADGITFWYPSDQLRLMSGYSGACQFFYSELAPFLLTEEDAVPTQIGAVQAPLSQQEARKAIEAAVTEGKLPHVPVTLGDRMTDVVDRYRLLRTPDEFPGGRYYVLEDPAFREILVISDAIQSGYGASVVEGVQMRRGDLCGLLIGQAVREDWHAILGEPDETMTFTDSMAYDYGLPVGESDIYHFGEHELRLHADTDGVLRAVQLGK